MIAKEGLPSLQWPTPPRYHVDGNRRLGDRDAEFEQSSGRAGFPSPVAGKTLAMPAHDCLRPDDAQGVKNARVAAIEPDEQDAVDPTQMQSPARRSLLQDVELMPQYQDFGFQPRSRLEEVAQHTDQ